MCEFITAGGFTGQELPQKLLNEGLLMRDALLRDLADLPYEITVTCDARIACPSVPCTTIQTADDPWQVWKDCMHQADAVWLIAPETDNILLKLMEMACLEGAWILGCSPAAVRVASRKSSTFSILTEAGVTIVPTYDYGNWPRLPGISYLAKPDDGAGCEDTVCFAQAEDLDEWLIQHQAIASHVVQPYLTGISASLSCIMHEGRAVVLSVNRQHIALNGHTLSFTGVGVNALPELWSLAEPLAHQVASALPGLSGYVGIDAILQDGRLVVIEINPRLTTSYVGLRESIGQNPAALILLMLEQADFKPGDLIRKRVDIHV